MAGKIRRCSEGYHPSAEGAGDFGQVSRSTTKFQTTNSRCFPPQSLQGKSAFVSQTSLAVPPGFIFVSSKNPVCSHRHFSDALFTPAHCFARFLAASRNPSTSPASPSILL